MGRAGRFGTKGLAITFVSSTADSEVLNQVRPYFHGDFRNISFVLPLGKWRRNQGTYSPTVPFINKFLYADVRCNLGLRLT